MAQYPSSAADDSNLYVAVNNKNTTLVGALTASGGNYSATEIEVSDTTGFPSSGLITIDTEVISYTGVATSPHRFTGITRGQDGSTAVSHINGASVIHTVVAAHHNVLKDEVKAIEADLLTSRPKWFNYIANGAAANDTTGWVTYADAAGTTPVDGVGGSPVTTWTRSTSSPLRGVASFVLTKDAANRQGEGVSYDFTIDAADKAKPLYVSFTYLPDTNYADDDIRVWLYDVTNAVLIQPAPYLLKDVVNAESWKGVFQTASNSTSYRLIIHIGSTNASAYTIKFDDLRISPEYAVMGSPVTDWVSYTPTFNAFGTVTNIGMKYRRVGDSIEILGGFQCGTTAANVGFFTLPSPLQIDTAKVYQTQRNILGTYIRVFSGVARNIYGSGDGGVLMFNSADATRIYFARDGASNSLIAANGDNLFLSNEYVTVKAEIPIVGWSSSVLMSDNADTRVVVARYTYSGGNTTYSTPTMFDFGTKVIDTHNAVSGAGGGMSTTLGSGWKFTAPVAGYYRINSCLSIGPTSPGVTGAVIENRIYKNGTIHTILNAYSNETSSISQYFNAGGSAIVQLNAGDYVQIGCWQSVANPSAGHNGFDRNWVDIERISGPSQIAATETVACRYQSDASPNMPNDATRAMDFEDKVYDTHNAVTGAGGGLQVLGSGWKFTAPVSGIYSVQAAVTLNTNPYTVGSIAYMRLTKNGSAYSMLGKYTIQSTTSQGLPCRGADSIRLLAGDYIQISFYQSTGGAVNINNGFDENYVAITRTGNY